MYFTCPFCASLSSTLKLYVSHLRIMHSKDPKFNIICGIGGCREVFRAFSAFSSHIYRHHRTEMGVNSTVEEGHLELGTDADATCAYGQESFEDEFESSDPVNELSTDCVCFNSSVSGVQQSSNSPEYLQRVSAAKMLLELREGHQVSQVAITDIIANCRVLCNQAINNMKTSVLRALDASGERNESIQTALHQDYDPFKNIDSNYLFEKFCVDHLGCLEAEEVTFGEPYYVDQFTGNKHQKVLKTDKFFYIPLSNTLRRLMELEDYQAEVLNPHINNDFLRDFCDGSFFKSHPLFSCDPYALQIIGYYDDLEIVNPLGSYIKKHKLGCLFFSLGNVQPQLQSTLKTIQLLAVGRTQDIQYYGINVFLRPFVEDLKQLYCNGISVPIGGESKIFHGGLIAFLADTLAAHLLGGFKGSMSFALRVCRSCMITSEQLQQCYSESTCGMRTSSSYFEQCSLLCGPLKDHYSKIYGINYLSVLEEVPGFSVIGGLPHDMMHDLYEGIVPYEMKLLLGHCVGQRYFTIDELNERMDRYGFTDNQPRPIDPSVIRNCESKIRQSASQMMTLSQHLPLLIGDRIPNDDIHWSSFLLLLKICCIANSPTFSPDTIEYFRILIEEKLLAFKELYPHEKLLPKHHYMVHYPSQIERLGPLVSSWTMRYESKLSFVKRVSHQSNFKNVCKTIAKKHQLWMCYQLLKEPHLLTPSLTFSPKFKSSPLISEDACVQSECFRLIPSLPLDYEITHPEWVRIQSSMLRRGTYIMTTFDIDRPLFGRIIDILRLEESTVIVYVQVYVGELFISHYNAFLIKPNGEFSVFNVCTLHDYRPVTVKSSFVQSDRELYVLLPYYY